MAVRGKHGLGKGLDSMIPSKKSSESNEQIKDMDVSRETLIDINDIEPNHDQPRRHFDEDGLQELTDSIRQYGIVQPLIIQKKEEGFEIVAGERRWRAARIAGLKKVPAIVKNYSEREVLEIALIENIQREDLNPIEEAQAYKRLIEEFNLKQDEVAEKVAKSRVTVTNSLRLLKLGSVAQQMLMDELITSGHARALLPIENVKIQSEIATRILDENLSVRETEKLVKGVLAETKKRGKNKPPSINTLLYREFEDKVKEIIGTKVTINQKNKHKGIIELEYYSEDDLERIVDLLLSIN